MCMRAHTHIYIYICEYVYICVGIHVYPALVRKLVVTVPGQELVRFKAFPDASVSPVQPRAASEDRTHDFRVIKFTRCQLRYQCRGDAGPTFAIAAMIIPFRFFQHFSRCARSPLFIPILLLRGALGLERVAGGGAKRRISDAFRAADIGGPSGAAFEAPAIAHAGDFRKAH